jgi:hypothetical protein
MGSSIKLQCDESWGTGGRFLFLKIKMLSFIHLCPEGVDCYMTKRENGRGSSRVAGASQIGTGICSRGPL